MTTSSDPFSPQVLTVVPDEIQAAAIVALLESHGIKAQATGGFTAGFRAEAPGGVQVVVRQADLVSAREILDESGEAAERGRREPPGAGVPGS
ncbi:MAG: DUF2007 domain-containing protein [Pirellulaceae bacterium]